MNVLSTSLILVLSTPGLAWIDTRRRRILPPYEEILRRLHDGELNSIREFTPHNRSTDILQMDPRFWQSSGGYSGLRRKHENAVCFVQLAQWYVRDSKMDKEDVDYFSERSFAIWFLNKVSVIEEPVRFFWRRMPHLFARWAWHLYWEAATEMRMLHKEYGVGILSI